MRLTGHGVESRELAEAIEASANGRGGRSVSQKDRQESWHHSLVKGCPYDKRESLLLLLGA